jgi:hypothetical protein
VVVDELAVRVHGALEDEPSRTGLEDVGLVIPVAVLGTGVGDQVHAERDLVEQRALGRIADDEHDRVHRLHREGVPGRIVLDQADQLPHLVEGDVVDPTGLVTGDGAGHDALPALGCGLFRKRARGRSS